MKEILLCFVILCLAPYLFGQEMVEKIEIVGNERVTRETVLYYLSSREGDYYSEELLRRDFRTLWSTGFFSNVCLGALIRGDTPHFDFLSAEITKGLAQVSMEEGMPVSFGILTVDTIEQGIERAGTKGGNKGWDAVFSVVETLNLIKESGLE
ncbi:unnamed protein product [marine sediment metagenome]|uniref:6,7-dimethyl-8-ribityllumazine synthase n=1 Tax=marine sediment metagenome TaxID=412755 RepID=X1V0F3_9ZZZZ